MLGVFYCLVIASLYVGLLYIWQGLPRDNPKTVVRRMLSIAVVCLVSWVPTYALASSACARRGALRYHKQVVSVYPDGQQEVASTLQLLGLRSDSILLAVVTSVCLASTLFAAPLLLLAMDIADDQRRRSGFYFINQSWLLTLRDVVVAPLTEEWAFRACMVPLLAIDLGSTSLSVAVVPLFFGVAHLHHAMELVSHQGLPWDRAMKIAGCQMIYTIVFGWYASWLFVRTGHFASPVVTHMFCNMMGLPDFGRILNHPQHGHLLSAALVAGIGLFAVCLWPVTEPRLYNWDMGVWSESLCRSN